MPARRPRRAAPVRLPENPSGVHLLSCPEVITALIDSSGVGPDDLVLDFGAGPGTITAPLAARGSRVLAVERDARFVATLRARFRHANVRVVHADVRTVALPRKAFTVVASIPFAVSTPLLRRLLTPVSRGFAAADVVVEWGMAKRLTAAHQRNLEAAWWTARHRLEIVRRIPRTCFSPPPRVPAAHLRIRRVRLDFRTQAILWFVLSEAYRRPTLPIRRALAGTATGKTLRESGVDGGATVARTPVARLRALAAVLAADRAIPTPKISAHM